MCSPKRYFVNTLPDYPGGRVTPDTADLKQKALALLHTIASKWTKNHQNCDGGLYVGLAGAVYTLHRLAKMPLFEGEREWLLGEARGFLGPALEVAGHTRQRGNKQDMAAFILGNGGVYGVAAVLYQSLGNTEECQKYLSEFAGLASLLTPLHWLSCGGDEFLVGRAGYLGGLLWLQAETGYKVVEGPAVSAMLDVMLESGQTYAHKHKSGGPLMYSYYRTEYLGAAHGLAGILLIMLSFPEWLASRPHARKVLRGAVDHLLSLQTSSGNFPCAMDEVGHQQRPAEDELVHWCHGAPGTIYLLVKAYQVFEDKKYLDACLRCGEVTWQKGLLKKGPGLCHGVAGSGYVFLMLYRLTRDPLHLHRALQFASFLYNQQFTQARTPDCPYSLFEGLAGTVCFLADLTQPDQSSFPLFNVF